MPFAVSAAELEETIRGAAGELLEAVFPFDLYEGKGLPEGTRSLAWRLRYRAADRTLTDADGVNGFHLVSGGTVVGRGWQAAEGAVDAPAWGAPVLLLEASLPAAAGGRAARYQPLPTHPGSERDLALLVPFTVPAAEREQPSRGAAGELLEAVFPFDLYEGKGLPEGTRSIAWRLRYRAADRTLTDADVDASVDRVLKALEEHHGVRRR